jgi:hypothetical protein
MGLGKEEFVYLFFVMLLASEERKNRKFHHDMFVSRFLIFSRVLRKVQNIDRSANGGIRRYYWLAKLSSLFNFR